MTHGEHKRPKLYSRRIWSNELGGYTYDGVTKTECQCYPLCEVGKEEQARHKERLKEVSQCY